MMIKPSKQEAEQRNEFLKAHGQEEINWRIPHNTTTTSYNRNVKESRT